MTERKLLLILAAVYFTYMLDFMVMPALTQIFARVFAMNPQQLGVLVAAYTFSAAVFGVVGSTMLDRFGRKPALLWLYGGFAVAMLLCALAPSYPFLMAARIVAGAFGGLVVSMTFSIVGDTVPAERQGAAFGLVMSTFSLSSVVGVPLGLWMAGLFGWQSIFYFISAACVVILFVVATLPAMNAHIAAARDRTFAMRLQAIFGRRSNLSAFLSTALVAVASYTIVPFLNPYFVANVGFTEQQLPLLYVAGGVLTFLISWPVGRLSDKFGKVKVYAVMSALLMPSTLAVTTIGLTPFAIATGIFVSYMVLSAGRRVPAAAVIASSVSPKERAGFLSFNTSVQQLSSGLSAAGAGLLLTQIKGEPMQGFGTVGIIATVAAVLAAVLLSQVKSSAMPVSAEQNSLPLAGLVAPKTVSANSPESK